MILDIEDYPELVKPRLYVTRPDRTIVGELTEAYGIKRTIQLGAVPTIDFRLPYRVHKRNQLVPNPNIDHARNRYLIKFVQGVTEEWYLIRTPSSSMDESSEYKSIEAYGLAFELADKTIRRYSAVSYSASQVLQDALGPTIWSLGYVDAAFDVTYRSFEYSGNVLDFVTQIANTFGALIDYDSVHRKVNLYKFDNYGRNKGLEVSYGSLLKHATVTENSDEFYTRFSAAGAEGIDITGQTVTGQNYIEDYSFFMYPFERDENRAVIRHSDYMSDALCHALLDYREALEANEGTYQGYLAQLSGLQEIVDDKTSLLRDLQVQLKTIEDSLSVANAAKEPTDIWVAKKTAKLAEIASQELLVKAAQTNVEVIKSQIAELQNGLALTSHFNPELLIEWNSYIIEGYYENSNVTDDKQLMELLVDEFEQYKQPKIVAEIGIVNLLECVTENKKWDKLNLGDIVTIRHTRIGIDVQAKMNQMTFDYENGDISLTISNVKDLTSRFMKDYNRNNLTSSNVISNSYKWNAAAVDVNEVQSVLDGVWDATKREITASNNETVEIGRQGIWLKDISDPMKIVVLQHGKIGLSNDGGNTWSTAIDASGVYAQRLVGQIIAGVGLTITNSGGTFTVDQNGVKIAGTSLTVTGGVPESQINSASTSKWNTSEANAKQYTDTQVNSLNLAITEFSNDNKLTPSEKQSIKQQWDIIAGEKPIIEAEAVTYGVSTEKTAFLNAFSALGSYLTPLLSNLNTTSDVVGADLRIKFSDYTTSRAVLSKAISEKAKTLADNAQTSANTANSLLADIANDGKFTAAEKQQVKLEWDTIVTEKTNIESQAATYGISTNRTTYVNAYNALSSYITPLLASLAVTSDIVGTTFRATFKSYYDTRTILLAEITDKSLQAAKTYSDSQLSTTISNLSSDNLLTGFEKQEVKRQWDWIVAEKPTLDAQADVYSITSEKTSLANSYNALNAYLSPLLADLTTTTAIVGATMRSNFTDYYSKRALLLKAISDKAVQVGKNYNNVVISSTEGITVVDTNTKSKAIMNKDGFRMQANTGNPANPYWDDRFYVDSNGDLNANNLRGTNAVISGKINATGGEFTGDITVNGSMSGNIKANSITANSLIQAPQIMGGSVRIGSGENMIVADASGFYAGASMKANAKTTLDMDGTLTTTRARIKGGSIEVTEDVKVGKNLYLGSSEFNVGKYIWFQTGTGISVIKFDPNSSKIVLSAENGVNIESGLLSVNNQVVATRAWVETSAVVTARLG